MTDFRCAMALACAQADLACPLRCLPSPRYYGVVAWHKVGDLPRGSDLRLGQGFGKANAITTDAQLLGRRECEQRALQRLLVEGDGRGSALDGRDGRGLNRPRLTLIHGDE